MKKIIKILSILVICCFCILDVSAKSKPTVYFFHGDGCPHCKEENKYLETVSKKINVEAYEVWYNEENEEFMNKVKEELGITETGVPLTIIGNTYFVGYSDASSKVMSRAIDFYSDEDNYIDQINNIKEGTFDKETFVDKFSEKELDDNDKYIVKVPILGEVNMKNLSLTTAAVVIGLVDGFNPCAMWVLLFLISILIGMKDKKRMWALGITFLVTSALVYMVIMFSWLNIVVRVSTSTFIRYLIGLFAIGGGIFNLYSYYKTRKTSGCVVVDDNKRKKIFGKIKKFTSEKSFILATLGVMALAVSVNMVELACSAGLPLIFTQLLALNNTSGIAGLYYTLIYIFFFLLDDLVIFIIAMITMNVTGISTKYNKYSHLIGGILMLIIGLLLIFKYEVLTFGL
ncbi:MAG: hypothetical protein Q4E69_03050 [Bacilli bacterium]|nr:hypothetical protein [Bacilli bacterium]